MITRVHNIAHVNCSTGTYFFPKQTVEDIKTMPKVFGGISAILSGDLPKLLPVQQHKIFIKYKNGEYQAFQGLLREDVFHLLEVTNIFLTKP